jgi:predicted nuclease with TOPRIM domain
MEHFKKSLEAQRKQQSELQMQLKKLEEGTKTEFQELHKEISERVNYLTELFKSDSNQQNKEFEYLELQNTTLHDEHDRLNEMVNNIMGRTEETENNVGI